MPGLNGAVYQIGNWTNLKPEVPGILKEYAKAAIRTDPRDLLQWQVAILGRHFQFILVVLSRQQSFFLKLNSQKY